jgi:hypothetical protein
MDLSERFWAKVDRSAGPDGCWEWTAGRLPNGYGKIWVDGISDGAHRVSWALAHGPIRDGLFVLHTCDNRPCVNPAHLYLGTQSDNIRDMDRRGRRPDQAGDRNPAAKLTWHDVGAIRRAWATGRHTQQHLAELWGISQPRISRIVSGQGWR